MMLRFVRALLFDVLAALLTVVMGLLFLPLTLWSEQATCWVMRSWGRLMLVLVRVVVGIRVEGPDLRDLPAGPVILAPNHQSSLDVIIMVAQPCSPVFVLKRELRRMPVIGWYAVRGGHILVDRDAGAPALRAMLHAAEAAVAKGRPLAIFPEGTRTPPGAAPELKPGIVAVASQLGATVVPIALNSGLCWGRKQFLKRPGLVAVVAHPPLAASLGRKTMLAALYAGINSLNHEDARR